MAALVPMLLGGLILAADTNPHHAGVMSACEAGVAGSLDELMTAVGDQWGFVLAEQPSSGKFVQFGLDSGNIVIDVPTQALDQSESKRAATLFADLGLDAPYTFDTARDERGNTYTQSAWQISFGRESGPAARVGCRVLREVYQLPEDATLDILVDTDWAAGN